MRRFFTRERVAWTAVTVVLLAALALFAFSPRLLAAGPEDETNDYLRIVGSVLRFVRDSYVDADKATPKTLYEGALKGIFEALGDPYSVYLTGDEMRDVNDTTTGIYGGVGLVITKLDKDGAEVISPIEGTPAYKAGISAGDVIIRIEGQDTTELSSDEIVKRLRGEPKTPVTVTIRRGESIIFEVTIVRETIEYPTVKHALIPGGTGYLRITSFTPQTADRGREAILALKSSGITSLVVDLRGNPGGLLSAAIDTADLFLSSGPIVSTRSDRVPAENAVYEAKRQPADLDPGIPVAVLVDRGSASASEILAGALKDTGRARLFGAVTYGKGSVQQVRTLGDGGFKLTMARYFTPGGYTIDKKGVEPDVRIEEPAPTPEEEKALGQLLQENLVRDFVRTHPQPSETEVTAFVDATRKRGIALPDRTLRRLVRDEANRTNNNPPVFDLEYDLVLQTAAKALQAGQVPAKAQP